jgi:hypothetical protein
MVVTTYNVAVFKEAAKIAYERLRDVEIRNRYDTTMKQIGFFVISKRIARARYVIGDNARKAANRGKLLTAQFATRSRGIPVFKAAADAAALKIAKLAAIEDARKHDHAVLLEHQSVVRVRNAPIIQAVASTAFVRNARRAVFAELTKGITNPQPVYQPSAPEPSAPEPSAPEPSAPEQLDDVAPLATNISPKLYQKIVGDIQQFNSFKLNLSGATPPLVIDDDDDEKKMSDADSVKGVLVMFDYWMCNNYKPHTSAQWQQLYAASQVAQLVGLISHNKRTSNNERIAIYNTMIRNAIGSFRDVRRAVADANAKRSER